jgi:hypothetical protein
MMFLYDLLFSKYVQHILAIAKTQISIDHVLLAGDSFYFLCSDYEEKG